MLQPEHRGGNRARRRASDSDDTDSAPSRRGGDGNNGVVEIHNKESAMIWEPSPLVNNKQPGASSGRRPVAGLAVGCLITVTGFQGEMSSVGEDGFQFSLQTKDYMPFLAPVIG
jgi:hypothetical protein